MKKSIVINALFSLLLVMLLAVAGCGDKGAGTSTPAQQVPELNLGYIFTNHHTPLVVAATKGEEFKNQGVYLKSVVEKERYDLMDGDKKLATLNFVVTKSGSETTTLFAQNNLDLGLASVTAIMSGNDKGTPIKTICPLQTDGMALVVPKDSSISNWESFLAYIKAAAQPVKIGYHSPTSAPRIVFEGALHEAGITITQDANDATAKVLMVDLKDTANLNPALTSKQVDGWVGPSPHPEVSVVQGVGKIALDLRDLPPQGYWHDFPCCVVAARDEVIAKNPEVIQKFVELMTKSSDWCNKNKEDAGTITANWMGVPVDAAKASLLVYSTKPTENWLRGTGIYMDVLNNMDKFSDKLKGKKFDDVKSLMFDFSFTEKANNK
ncbi:MAG: ABC transporter substrate-binding protein [Desulfotomaculaceae bacterium]|nr:ABC transporter substrate-binding protein [Desulfotomaculaceae bacterium]